MDAVDLGQAGDHDLRDSDRRRVVLRLTGEVREGQHGDHRWPAELAGRGGPPELSCTPGEGQSRQGGETDPHGAPPGGGGVHPVGGRARRVDLGKALAHVAQLAREVQGRGVAFPGLLREAALDDPPRGRGQAWVQGRDGLGHVVDDRGGRLRRCLAPEGLPARRHLVEDRTQGELVGAVVHQPPPGLFRGHVPGRAEDDADRGLGRRRLRPRGGGRVEILPLAARSIAAQLDEAEVEDLHEAVGRHHDVVGLQVTVNDARGVGLGEALRDLRSDLEETARGEGVGLAAQDQLPKRVAVDQLHDDVAQARGRLADVVDGDDVGVVQRGGGAGLLAEAAETVRVAGELLGQELHRDVAVQVVVARSPDLAHASSTQAGEELVSSEPHAGRGRHGARGPRLCRGRQERDYARPLTAVKGSCATSAPGRLAVRRTGRRSRPCAARG